MGRAAYAPCRCLRADTAPVRRSDRGERDRAAGMALTIRIVAEQSSGRRGRDGSSWAKAIARPGLPWPIQIVALL